MSVSYRLVLREQYLSGDVRSKLQSAKRAAVFDERFEREVKALEEVQPPTIDLREVFISPGAMWIPLHDYAAFCREVLGVTVSIVRSDYTSFWEVEPMTTIETISNRQTYGLSWVDMNAQGEDINRKLTGVQLFRNLLNSRVPSIKIRRYAGQEEKVKDPILTANALDKQLKLKQAFVNWCLEPERKQRLESLYNMRCNNLRLRSYDGSQLKLQMTKEWANQVAARPYQLNGIYRGLVGNWLEDEMSGLGLFWKMGLGKTIAGIAVACERILNQTAKRAMIAVKKQTLEDFAYCISQAYPQLKVMVATADDLTNGKRQLFFARAVYNRPDVIIVTHEQYGRLGLRKQTELNWVNEQMDEITQDKLNCDRQSLRRNGSAVKALERARARLEEKIRKIQKRHDDSFCFEDLQIDFLVVDEYDVFKNGALRTKLSRVAGINCSPSNRADDFDLKQWWVHKTHGSGRIVLMTGTFISNSLVELWRVFMHLAPTQMRMRGWHLFDDWAAACGHIKTGAAITSTGTIARESRFCEIVNFPEQMALLHSVADIQDHETVGIKLNEPKPKYRNVAIPMTSLQRAYMDELVRRANLVKAGTPTIFYRINDDGEEEPYFDNMLLITTDGRKACLDFRLIDPEAKDAHKTKVNACIRRVAKIWKKTKDVKAVQIIFCDLGTPNPDKQFTVYDHVVKGLIAQGVDPEEIAIAQQWDSSEKRRELHLLMREGVKRAVIASTEFLGVGANVHTKLFAIHHLSVQWRPRDMMQREGRAIRPGNMFDHVFIYRYITQGVNNNTGFDSFIWDRVRMKIRFISKLFSGDVHLRVIEEDASQDPAFSVSQIVALATGDPRLMEYVELEGQLQLNQMLLAGYRQELDQILHHRQGSNYQSCIPWIESDMEYWQEQYPATLANAALAREHEPNCTGGNYQVIINGEVETDREIAGEKIRAICRELELQRLERRAEALRETIGFYGGFELLVQVEGGADYFILRHPSGNYTDYDSKMPQTPELCGRKLEKMLQLMIEKAVEIEEEIQDKQEMLVKARAAAVTLEQKIDQLNSVVATQEIQKQEMEEALGLSDRDDAMASAHFDDDDDD